MNNLFSYATKELSQNAILCWCINWLNYPGHPLYQLGKAVLDLFLGKEKLDEYQNVEVKQQYEKIDILVLFSGKKNGCINDYALMIEDKTNTSEHSRQIERYKTVLAKDFPNRIGYSSYIKTGIMYDGDWLMTHNVNAVIDLNKLLAVIQPFQGKCSSEILDSFCVYLTEIKNERKLIEDDILSGNYDKALESAYGQFYFLDTVFSGRTKGTIIGNVYSSSSKTVSQTNNPAVYIDIIYA
jgi:hypothetical protein